MKVALLLILAITTTAFAWPPKPPKCSEKMPCKEIKCKVAECKYKYKSKYGYCVYTDDEECCYSDKDCPEDTECEKDGKGMYYITTYTCEKYECVPKKVPCCPPKAECDCDKLECPKPSKCEKDIKDGKYYITSYYCKYFKCYPKKTPCCPPCPPDTDCYKIKKGKWYKYIKDTYTCSAKTNYVCVKNTVKCPKKP